MTLIITNAFEWVMLTLRSEVRAEYCSETVPSHMFYRGVCSPLNANFILRILSHSIIGRVERKISVLVN